MKSKADLNFNFNPVSSFDVESLVDRVNKFSNEWDIDTSRQSTVYEGRPNPHVNTHTYIIQNSSLYWERGTLFSKELIDQEFYELLKNIVKELEDRMVGQSARILLIKLDANSEVFVHKDSGDYLSNVRRFHIPLITNEKVYYTVGGEEISMEQGKCYEINNLKLHSVNNTSDYDRVHLLIDIMPECEIKTINNVSKDFRVKLIRDFVSQEDSDILIDYIQKNYLDDKRFYTPKKTQMKKKFRYESHVPEMHTFSSHPEIIDILKKYSDKFLFECRNFFKDKEDIYLTAQWLTMLGEGTKLPAHVDNHEDAEHLFRSGVMYLNDDFDGGYLRFLNEDLTIKPEKLSMVIFESTQLHEITPVLSGLRIAMPIWATNIKEKGITHG
jgi:aspartyl/asparaginyl beta-hydroxylase (cupin superfamily)